MDLSTLLTHICYCFFISHISSDPNKAFQIAVIRPKVAQNGARARAEKQMQWAISCATYVLFNMVFLGQSADGLLLL